MTSNVVAETAAAYFAGTFVAEPPDDFGVVVSSGGNCARRRGKAVRRESSCRCSATASLDGEVVSSCMSARNLGKLSVPSGLRAASKLIEENVLMAFKISTLTVSCDTVGDDEPAAVDAGEDEGRSAVCAACSAYASLTRNFSAATVRASC